MLKRVLFNHMEKSTVTGLGPFLRRWGQSLFKSGVEMTGDNMHQDRLVRSLRSVPLNNKVFPKVLSADWVAPNATVIGDVEVGEGSSLWHTVVLRGDTAKIRIGKNSIIQDRVLLKSSIKGEGEINIGNNVFVGPNVQLDACTLDHFAYIGMGATIHRDAIVEPYAMVAAGAVIPEGTVVPSGQVWAGNPAHYLRDVTQEEKHQISDYVIEMQQLSQIYCEETEMTFREQLDRDDDLELWDTLSGTEKAAQILHEKGLPLDYDDMEHIEHRISSQYNLDATDKVYDELLQENVDEYTWNPYEQDLTKYPEIFKMYGENYERYQKVKARFDNEKHGEQFAKAPIEPEKPKDQSPWQKKYDDYLPKYTGEYFN